MEELGAGTDGFFRAHIHPIIADPRFIGVANRLRLLAYWKKSGIWPDFCSDPQLPYDCRREAEKYSS